MILGTAAGYYLASLLIFAAVDVIAVWGFDLQFGTTRVLNLSFLVCQALGAYVSAMLTIGPPQSSLGEQYLFGAKFPLPFAWAGGAIAAAVFSILVGTLVVPRLKAEYFAIVTLVIGVGAFSLVSAYGPLFNGDQGLSGVPLPFSHSTIPSIRYFWVMAGITCGIAVVCGWAILRIHAAPVSRRLRAIRDNDGAAGAVGIGQTHLKIVVMGLGGALGGLSGVILVNAFGAWGTGSWELTELMTLITAVIIGGSGNPLGVVVGVVVLVSVGQGIEFIPGLHANGYRGASLQAALFSVLTIGFLWFRPKGLFPERIRRAKLPAREVDQQTGIEVAPFRPEVRTRVQNGDATGVVLRVEALAVWFGGVAAVRDCTFAVRSGITCVVGPNGAGKSTVVGTIAGRVRPRSGRIVLDGEVLTGSPYRRVERGVVSTFQLPQEFGTMTVLENVQVGLSHGPGTRVLSAVFGKRRWQREDLRSLDEAAGILELCGLMSMANVQAGLLSGGQKKLLELARALACHPRLLLLDEPTAGVAPHLHEQMTGLLEQLRAAGISMLVVSHEMSLVRAIADDVIVMADGSVLIQGKFDQIAQHVGVQDAYLGRDSQGRGSIA